MAEKRKVKIIFIYLRPLLAYVGDGLFIYRNPNINIDLNLSMIKNKNINFNHNKNQALEAMGLDDDKQEFTYQVIDKVVGDGKPTSKVIEEVIKHDKLNDAQKVFALMLLGADLAHPSLPLDVLVAQSLMKKPQHHYD